MTKKERQVKNNVARCISDDNFLFAAASSLFEAQTFDEQQDKQTRWRNLRGFNVVHSEAYTELIRDAIERGYLTSEEATSLRKIDYMGFPFMACYWRQLSQLPEYSDTLEKLSAPRLPPTKVINPTVTNTESA